MKKSSLNARYLFLSPPSLETLAARLRGRASDSEEAIQVRLAQAENEMEYSQVEGVHDKIIVNDDLEKAAKELDEWVMAGI